MRSFFDHIEDWGQQRFVHVYLTPSPGADAAVTGLADQAAEVASGHACVAPVAARWRHATVAAAADPDVDRDWLTTVLRQHLEAVPAFVMTMGSVAAGSLGIAMDGNDRHGGFARLRGAILAGLGEAGLDAFSHTLPPHITVAYGTGDGDSGVISDQLWLACRPPHADWDITQAHIVDVEMDAAAAEFRWTVLATVPLVSRS